jgi:proteasome lid subunit RPN8/RPN11
MTEEVRIRSGVLADMVAHARQEDPRECCGLLIGSTEGVALSWRARNLEESPSRYLIDPEDHFRAIRHARAIGKEVVGAYHSHPHSPPDPSQLDLERATYAGFLYVIVSTAEYRADVAAYRFRDGNFCRVTLVITA